MSRSKQKLEKAGDDHGPMLQNWFARDLTRAADADELLPAFEVDPLIEQVCAVLAAGKHPLVVGDSGVGKTAVIHELLRRHRAGLQVPRLDGCRVVEVSIRQLEAEASENEPVSGVLKPRLEAVLASQPPLVLHLTDCGRATRHDLAGLLRRFAALTKAPILAEGLRTECQSNLESSPELLEFFVPIYIEEPSLAKMELLLPMWAAEQERRGLGRYATDGYESALHLAHRFLSRTRMPRAVLDVLSSTATLAGPRARVDQASVTERFCATQRVRRELVDPALRIDLDEVTRGFEAAVLGQGEAVRAMVAMIGALKSGLTDTRRSLGVFLFVGPTGVGKTHLAQVLATYMFGGSDRMVRFNMADYKEGDATGELFGRTDYASRGEFTKRLAGCPFGVVLLDEFEKASVAVHDRFLQLFDEGAFVNGANEYVSCRSMIFIATSNAGAEIYRGRPFGFLRRSEPSIGKVELQEALENIFRFELLNRFDAVVHFYPLTREDIRAIGLREIGLLKSRAGVRQRKAELEIDDAVLDWLAANGCDAHFGARFLRRTVERNVTAALAETLVRQDPPVGSVVRLFVRANRIHAEVQSREPARRATMRHQVKSAAGRAGRRAADSAGLHEEAARVLEGATGLFARLEEQRAEYSELFERMNATTVWSADSARVGALRRFRELDVSLRMQERLAEPLLELRRISASGAGAPEPGRLGEAVSQAAQSAREWQLRLEEAGPSSVWMVISNADPLHSAREWLTQVTEMELAWCREHLHLTIHVVAYEAADTDLARVVLEVEGPGARAQLEPERGLHRLHKSQRPDRRVRLELVARGAAVASAWPHLEPAPKRAPQLFGLNPTCRARLELPQRGTTVELLAENEDTLQQLVGDLRAPWSQPPAEADEVARHYNEDGCGARDPRTGAVVVSLREVLRGELEPFLEARRQERRPPIGSPSA